MKRRVYLPMVRWYSPRQLFRTFIEVIQAVVVTRIVDPRALARADGSAESPLDWHDEDEFWFDYVADTGDGWNSTFSVARTLAQKWLTLRDPAQRTLELPRATLLVLGGDLVYPTPRDDNYETRLVGPFVEALEKAEQDLVVAAIPGNHDWYDGLYEFNQRFCEPGNRFAAWRTKQAHSYFAVALPGDWWLLGVDAQLGRHLDEEQLRYFRQVKRRLTDASRVILVLPEPDWLELPENRHLNAPLPSHQMESLLGRTMEICIAGNFHHYRRHETIPDDPTKAPQQRITAGGGGAFLHATHDIMHRSLRNRLVARASFPPPRESQRYLKQLLAFPFLNPSFGLVPALLYGLIAIAGLTLSNFTSYSEFVGPFAESLQSPGGTAVLGLALFGTWQFRQRGSLGSIILALGHFAAQVAGVSVAAYLAHSFVKPFDLGDWELTAAVIGTSACGWIIGSTLVGFHLWLSAACGLSLDYAYSALQIQDWKSFLRIRVKKDGSLTIYPIGLRRIAHTWRTRTSPSGESRLEPEDNATPPELIEVPIEVAPRS